MRDQGPRGARPPAAQGQRSAVTDWLRLRLSTEETIKTLICSKVFPALLFMTAKNKKHPKARHWENSPNCDMLN